MGDTELDALTDPMERLALLNRRRLATLPECLAASVAAEQAKDRQRAAHASYDSIALQLKDEYEAWLRSTAETAREAARKAAIR